MTYIEILVPITFFVENDKFRIMLLVKYVYC